MDRSEDRSQVSVVGPGTKIEGTVVAAGSLRVEGEVKGKITAEGEVALSPQGRVEARIEAGSLTLAGGERDVRWLEYVAMARAAEASGFDSMWLGDHLLYRGDGRPERGPWEAWTLLSALAAVTERIGLGPLVACLAFHSPGLIAKMAATVDEVSGGRFVLGVGAGWNEPEFRAFGIPFDHRVSRFEESFELVRRLAARG